MENNMSRDSKVKWLIIALLIIADTAWMFFHSYRLVLPWELLAFVFLMVSESTICYHCWWATNSKWLYYRVGHCCHVTAQLTVFLCAAVILSDLMATTDFPFIDHTLSVVDQSMGFDWLRWRA